MRKTVKNCIWGCGHVYEAFSRQEEDMHLSVCLVYQSLPVAEAHDGKEYVALPGDPDILVWREKRV